MMIKVTALILTLLTSACAVNQPIESNFALEMVPVHGDGETRHVKYNRTTGETWWASDTTWAKIQENGTIARSDYEVKIVATGTSWRAIRIDKNSGLAWKNSRGTWISFKEKVEQ